MSRTYFQEFTRDNGLPITVEYSATGGEPDFDYPGHICDGGGSGALVMIENVWPNTPWHNRLASAWVWLLTRPNLTPTGAWLAEMLRKPVGWLMAFDEWWRASLTDDEREKFEAWIAERYVEEPYDDYEF